jgi:hypothetical protein
MSLALFVLVAVSREIMVKQTLNVKQAAISQVPVSSQSAAKPKHRSSEISLSNEGCICS